MVSALDAHRFEVGKSGRERLQRGTERSDDDARRGQTGFARGLNGMSDAPQRR